MADQVDYEIVGDDFQAVNITLDPGEAVRAEPGAMMYLEPGIHMETTTGGGLLKGLKRMVGGESFFVTTYENRTSQRAKVGFSAAYPGKIMAVDLTQGPLFCQRDAYLCSADGIDVTVAFTKRLGAGFFGGEGFILQKLSGDGLAFVHAGGFVIERDLAPGEELRVDTGCIVAFQESVDYDIQRIKGVKSMLFGGEGLFYAILRGPGKIFIQTTPFSRFADRVMSAAGSSKGQHKRGGDLLGSILGGE